MKRYTTHQAKTHFSKILKEVAEGEEVVVMNRDKPVARIVPAASGKEVRLGWLNGDYEIAPDFDEPLEDFKDYMK